MNAKNEFHTHLATIRKSTQDVMCAFARKSISRQSSNKSEHLAILTKPWRQEDMDAFLEALDFEYDSGYGTQQVYGTIWFKDGTWSDRGEYDGSEWWDHRKVPSVPADLICKERERDIKLGEIGI